jgi:hypothetical protein
MRDVCIGNRRVTLYSLTGELLCQWLEVEQLLCNADADRHDMFMMVFLDVGANDPQYDHEYRPKIVNVYTLASVLHAVEIQRKTKIASASSTTSTTSTPATTKKWSPSFGAVTTVAFRGNYLGWVASTMFALTNCRDGHIMIYGVPIWSPTVGSLPPRFHLAPPSTTSTAGSPDIAEAVAVTSVTLPISSPLESFVIPDPPSLHRSLSTPIPWPVVPEVLWQIHTGTVAPLSFGLDLIFIVILLFV